MESPTTPRRRALATDSGTSAKATVIADRAELQKMYTILESRWGVRLSACAGTDSPRHRIEKRESGAESLEEELITKCRFKASYLSYKAQSGLIDALERFDRQAHALHSGWVYKSGADPSLIPRSRNNTYPVSTAERMELWDCLHGLLQPLYERVVQELSPTKSSNKTPMKAPATLGRYTRVQSPSLPAVHSPDPMRNSSQFSQQPIPISSPFSAKKDSKRQLEAFDDVRGKNSKKIKTPPSAERLYEAVDYKRPDVPEFKTIPLSESVSKSAKCKAAPPSKVTSISTASKAFPKSFTSFTTNVSNIFSQTDPGSFANSTQETEPDDDTQLLDRQFQSELQYEEKSRSQREIPMESWIGEPQSSVYGSSIDDTDPDLMANLDAPGVEDRCTLLPGPVEPDFDVHKTDKKQILLQRLNMVFPNLPSAYDGVPFHVRYEATRIFVHAGIPLADAPLPPKKLWSDYDKIWEFLKSRLLLSEKEMPEKGSKDVWRAAVENQYTSGFSSVVFAAKMLFSSDDTDTAPFFCLKLLPMKFELSHRAGRAYGHDRFLSIELPQIDGRKVPSLLHNLGDEGRGVVLDWLCGRHLLVGRTWEVFWLKPSDVKKRKAVDPKRVEEKVDNSAAHTCYFFAVDGGLRSSKPEVGFTKMTRQDLLNGIRPTWENRAQPFLKLFARTALALSRNYETVTLDPAQIRRRRDLEHNGEVMTDGAGLLSPHLAMRVATMLGLTYVPTLFQGRFGEAKGTWTIDPRAVGSVDDWIELYDSQCKWTPATTEDGQLLPSSHRTLEVLKWSGPLKSADLNTQFTPLLMRQSSSPANTRKTIKGLLEKGLEKEVENLRAAMDSPMEFRDWIRAENPNLSDRLTGEVSYRAGMPTIDVESLNLLLDAGFDPQTQYYIKSLAKKLFIQKCDNLKERLNITVGQSTYVLMIPDFWDVLRENEVYLDFSSFTDQVSGCSAMSLNGKEVLVARTPAHYASDIQRVKVVAKVELMGLKDVIVFPIKGNPSLAQKLSGGDYDGDIAWVCWEEELVKNFVNSSVPVCPDLIKRKYVKKNSTTYEGLVNEKPGATCRFIRESFDFNMRQNLLGTCTMWKEKLVYNLQEQGGADHPDVVLMSTLLSWLVDAPKQGYSFTESDWTRLRKEISDRFKPGFLREPLYRTDILNPKAKDIIDYLKFVAKKTVDKALTTFHRDVPDPPYFDQDVAKYYEWAKKQAVDDIGWKRLCSGLDEDIQCVKHQWTTVWRKDKGDEESRKENYGAYRDAFFRDYSAISPRDPDLARTLLPSCFPEETSEWALLKASAFFASYPKGFDRRIAWEIAGLQFARLKARALGGSVPVIPRMYTMLKPDTRFVKQFTSGRHQDSTFTCEEGGPSNADQLVDLLDDA